MNGIKILRHFQFQHKTEKKNERDSSGVKNHKNSIKIHKKCHQKKWTILQDLQRRGEGMDIHLFCSFQNKSMKSVVMRHIDIK